VSPRPLPRPTVSSASRVHVGTSGWAYASWKPGFYPPTVPAKKFLEYYAGRLNSVEVNYTFTKLPTSAMVAGWLAAAAGDFSFSFKAPRRVTHTLRLRNCGGALAAFAAALGPVAQAGRMGLVLLQLPPNFKADSGRLEGFLTDAEGTAPGLRMAVEFRHLSWFTEETYAVLRAHGAALCIAESDALTTPDVATAPFCCYRFRKNIYSARALSAIAKKLRERGGDVFAYFKHEEEPTGALWAVETLKRLGVGPARPTAGKRLAGKRPR